MIDTKRDGLWHPLCDLCREVGNVFRFPTRSQKKVTDKFGEMELEATCGIFFSEWFVNCSTSNHLRAA